MLARFLRARHASAQSALAKLELQGLTAVLEHRRHCCRIGYGARLSLQPASRPLGLAAAMVHPSRQQLLADKHAAYIAAFSEVRHPANWLGSHPLPGSLLWGCPGTHWRAQAHHQAGT